MPIPALTLPDHGIRVDLYYQRATLLAPESPDAFCFANVDELTVTAVIDTTETITGGRTAAGVPQWARVHEVTDYAPAAALVILTSYGVRGCYLVPIDMGFPASHRTYGSGGAFAHGNDDRFTFLTGGTAGAIAVHDRIR